MDTLHEIIKELEPANMNLSKEEISVLSTQLLVKAQNVNRMVHVGEDYHSEVLRILELAALLLGENVAQEELPKTHEEVDEEVFFEKLPYVMFVDGDETQIEAVFDNLNEAIDYASEFESSSVYKRDWETMTQKVVYIKRIDTTI